MTRMTISELKQKVSHPELVEMHDVTAKDPLSLLNLKSTRNTVPVPRHWCYKRKYLQGKRGYEKPAFRLPDFIKRTGIMEMREALQEKEDAKTLKAKMKEKIRPKLASILLRSKANSTTYKTYKTTLSNTSLSPFAGQNRHRLPETARRVLQMANQTEYDHTRRSVLRRQRV